MGAGKPDSGTGNDANIKNSPEMLETNDHFAWFSKRGWKNNPFTFHISPALFVGYKTQVNSLISAIEERQKIVLLVGPTGSGKTSMLKWIADNLPDRHDYIFIGKPPSKAEEFVDIFRDKFPKPWYLPWQNIKNLHQLPKFLNGRLSGKTLVVMLDECHESDLNVLEWLRVISDQVDNMILVLSGLPVFEVQIRDKLETLRKRIAAKVEVLSLTKEEMREMMEKRIAAVGGTGLGLFDDKTIDTIYESTGGFPREVIRYCNDLIKAAIEKGRDTITEDLTWKEAAPKKEVSLDMLEKLTPMQKGIIDILAKKSCSPGEVANMLDLSKYKSRQHAVRSVNNITKRLLQEGLLERAQRDRAYVYQLSPRIKTLVVQS
ncbi:MAG: AAA family ATPase [Candidatus Aenigmarchaeota archaeon]|nr:AAA family ATPase [Candidatus Aenigmarchaeota archaeon]